ncbi:MAG: tRNA pseudouridine(55) synthase TruB, partial [Pseudomonadota bacterium]
MARRRNGKPITGWLLVDKPAGLTSTDVVNNVRWRLQAQKAGHCGTLDPDATGLLVVALGEATKVVPHITDALKCYEFMVTWGARTSTDDASGAQIATSEARPDREAIEACLPNYMGEIEQIPPQVSAVKVDGARAYELAREGAEMALKPRPLWVEDLTLLDCPDQDHARFSLTCGKGGYVRSIARDLGEDLGCLGHVQSLRRLWSSGFEVQHAVPYDLVKDEDTPLADHILPLVAGLSDLPRCDALPALQTALQNGQAVAVYRSDAAENEPCWVSCDD